MNTGKTDIVKLLIKKVDVNSRDKWGNLPLTITSRYGHLDIVQILIDHGANVNVKDKNGLTPLFLASSCGYIKLTKILLERKANVEQDWLYTTHNRIKKWQQGNSRIIIR